MGPSWYATPEHLVKAPLKAHHEGIVFDPLNFDATTPITSVSQSFTSDVEEEDEIIDDSTAGETAFAMSLKRGAQAAKLARPGSAAAVKYQKGGQNVAYNMVSRLIANADGTLGQFQKPQNHSQTTQDEHKTHAGQTTFTTPPIRPCMRFSWVLGIPNTSPPPRFRGMPNTHENAQKVLVGVV